MKQILYQTKGAHPSAQETSQKAPKEKEESKHCKRNVMSVLIEKSLQRSHRTRCQRSGTGIAVQSRYTDIF